MKIAIPYENGKVFQHFGHTAQFKIYDVQDGAVTASRVVSTNGSGHGALSNLLRLFGVDALICGGIGGGARSALESAGIGIYGGVSGDADKAAQSFAEGGLVYDPDAKCEHHHGDHGHSHNCSDHGCGSHSCGGNN